MATPMETVEVKKKTGDKGTALINAEDFDPELHERTKEKPRKFLASDAVEIGPQAGTLDAAAIKEFGEPKTKAQKDALDNAKVVKDPDTVDPKGGTVAVGKNAPQAAKVHKANPEKDGETKENLVGNSAGVSPVGEGVPVNPNMVPGKKGQEPHASGK
jgi:hypothetical protein